MTHLRYEEWGEGAFARNIETATRAWAEKLWRRWGKRCSGTNKYFKKREGPQSWAISVRDFDIGQKMRADAVVHRRAQNVVRIPNCATRAET